MFEPLLAADPSFALRWAEFLTDWGDEPDPPLYLALGSLAEHLLQRLKKAEMQGLDQVFAVIEDWHTAGDVYVNEAATIGLLEGLQNLSDGNDRPTMIFDRWLGPETRRWWNKLDRFWGGDDKALKFE